MFSSIYNTLRNCFKIPELKSRILFTLGVLAVCRLASLIPTPGLDSERLMQYFASQGANANPLMGMYSLFTGGGFERCAIGSLGIMPYISATIIIQLLTAVVPFLSKLSREEGGRAKIVQYGRVLTLFLCLGQGAVMAIGWENAQSVFQNFPGDLVYNPGWWYRIQTTFILTTGAMMLMWLGEQITERGIGNGISLVITIGILARLPAAVRGLWDMFVPAGGTTETGFMFFHGVMLIGLLAVVIAGTIAVTQAQRKIPVQYAQRAVGRKIFSGSSSFMPLRVNYAGVMPVIFASAILMFPAMILQQLGSRYNVKFLIEFGSLFQERGHPTYLIMYGGMILFFSYFWVATQFNELQIADDMKKSGGYIPGVRPGTATSDFLHRAMTRITLAGAIFLTIIAVIPIILASAMKIPTTVAQFFGGTSLLIIVGVMLDTMRQMESHLLMRHYDGFLKKGRIRGRF
jgi:preprotein translocase subunit SecY